MHHDDLFPELRSILQRPASKETWDALCDHLQEDLWGAEALEAVALPYALGIVAWWPGEVERALSLRRPAPELSAGTLACLQLADTLILTTGGQDGLVVLERLASAPQLRGVRSIALHGSNLNDADLYTGAEPVFAANTLLTKAPGPEAKLVFTRRF